MSYKDFLPLIKELADESPAVERCGVIKADEFLTFDNTHDDSGNHFLIGAKDVATLRSDYIVWHTHTPKGFHELTPSDIRTARFLKKPILMVRAGDGAVDYFDPTAQLPYLGRTWRTYHRNCYDLMRDWYQREMLATLPEFFLDEPEEFMTAAPSKFLQHLGNHCFHKVCPGSNLRIGDVVLTTEAAIATGWHCSIVTALNPVQCLSQFVARPSCYFPYRAIQSRTDSIWRWYG